MRDNINKVSERGARLDSLQDKTDNLAVSAQGFRRGANRVRKQMWWKDMKMRMCLIGGIIILLIVIIVPSGEFVEQLVLLFVLLTWTSRCHAKEVNHPHEIPRIIHINNCADGGRLSSHWGRGRMATSCTTINDMGHCRMCLENSSLFLHSDGRAAITESPFAWNAPPLLRYTTRAQVPSMVVRRANGVIYCGLLSIVHYNCTLCLD